ncbi:Hypothetical predicted protein [Paramuricea clavata]|uniref:Uncharacterized protein n=1 Tax=Paramuricea clavata TaxID=317549 RepID=A0A6S7IQQ9_PARCT|nr:Hypothetical predicted protein [Paramuricea clavata]
MDALTREHFILMYTIALLIGQNAYSNLPILRSFVLGPQREVVSIYDDNFSTPSSRPQYFIEVYRCVKIEVGECSSDSEGYPVPNKTEEIEIVVPDITNKDRDPNNEKKFYKYVVYNHTSCKCGNLTNRNKKLYKTTTDNEVFLATTEVYFNASYANNPVNLIRQCNVCNSPQPRYNLIHEHVEALPQYKYLAYEQCLPGCVVVEKDATLKNIQFTSGDGLKIVTNDISCKAYDGRNKDPQKIRFA